MTKLKGNDFIEKVRTEIDQRLPLDMLNLGDLMAHKEVPKHRMSWAYYLGGFTLFFFIVQVVTGLMLLFYYKPTVSEAHASVEYITHQVSAGALVRNMHTWASSLMILSILIHLITTFAMKAFEKPRELTWVTGVALLLITFTFGFTGYLLPWNQIAVNATKIGLQTIEQVGHYLPGDLATWPRHLREIIQGEASVGQSTLSRFYAIHVVVLPFLIFGLLGVHLLVVQLHGMSKGVDEPAKGQEKFFPFFILKDFSAWGIAFLALFLFALCLPFESFFPYPLFEPYDALGSTPEGIKPEWYFFFMYYPLELLPFWLVMLGVNGAMVVLLFAPWIFKGSSRKTLRFLAVLAALYLFVMTVFGDKIYHLVKGVGG
ncbi:MAG TPA: cytochrome b N-terminal domain-containing protein [bacterium]|nr:cytochrome b N-terminal domain-containing protein [bacterium]